MRLSFSNVASSEGYLGPMSVSTRIKIITNQVVVIVFFVCVWNSFNPLPTHHVY